MARQTTALIAHAFSGNSEIFQENSEAITGQSPRGIRGLDRFLQKEITESPLERETRNEGDDVREPTDLLPLFHPNLLDVDNSPIAKAAVIAEPKLDRVDG